MSMDWLNELRVSDPEAAAVIDHDMWLENIGAAIWRAENPDAGKTLISWGELQRIAREAGYE